MKKILGLLAFLCALPALAFAQLCPSVATGANFADTVQFWANFTRTGDTGFTIEAYINGAPWWQYPTAQFIGPQGNCDLHHCFPYQFTALEGNTIVEYRLVDGNQGGWRCRTEFQVFPHVQNTPLPQVVKDKATQAKGDTDWWLGKATYAGPVICALWDAGCVVIGLGAVGLQYHSENLGLLIADPPTDCYASNGLNFPDPNSLGNGNVPDMFGDGVTNGYGWGILYWASQMNGYGRYAYDEANSASACYAIGDNGTGDWRSNNVRWAVANYAQNAANMAVHFRVLANEFAYYWNPGVGDYQYPCDAANWQYYAERPDVQQSDYYGPMVRLGQTAPYSIIGIGVRVKEWCTT